MSSPKSKRALLVYFGATKIAFLKVEQFKDTVVKETSSCAKKIYALIKEDLSLFDEAGFPMKPSRADDAGEFRSIHRDASNGNMGLLPPFLCNL